MILIALVVGLLAAFVLLLTGAGALPGAAFLAIGAVVAYFAFRKVPVKGGDSAGPPASEGKTIKGL